MESFAIILDRAINIFGVSQSAFYHRNELAWSEIDYYLQVRQVHVDTLNNLREDLRDLYDMDARKLDNSMIVTTLMLTIGFGFVVEGTFPPSSGPGADSQRNWRILYAVVAALALICPFWSMLCLIECRRRLDFFMDRFTHKFYELLKKRVEGFDQDTSDGGNVRSYATKYTSGLPRLWPHMAVCRAFSNSFNNAPCRRRATGRRGLHADGQRELDGQARLPDPLMMSEEDGRNGGSDDYRRADLIRVDMAVVLELHNHYAWWWQVWCQCLYTASAVFHWLGIIFNVLVCAILLGMYFSTNYPDTPLMWKLYSGIVLIGLLAVLPFLVLVVYCGPHGASLTKAYKDSKDQYNVACEPPGMPKWMREDSRVLERGHTPVANGRHLREPLLP